MQTENKFDFDPPESFRVIEHPGGSRTQIDYRVRMTHRQMPLAIGGIVLSMAGVALLTGGGGGEGLLPDLVKAVGDHPAWSKVLRITIIAGFAYLAFRIAQMVFGTLRINVDSHSLEIKKGRANFFL